MTATRSPIRGQFSSQGRNMALEDRVTLLSVGVDIGSSTTHLMFSRIELERVDARYVTVSRVVVYESNILLTPYLDDVRIDERGLEEFITAEYAAAGLDRSEVDTGALILTGVALDRRNARTVANLFAEEAGRFVAVSAGDNLEAALAAVGSGAVSLSEAAGAVLNVDIGGGTTKVALCRNGSVEDVMAIDVGARLVAFDDDGVVTRIEPTASRFAERAGVDLAMGRPLDDAAAGALAREMVRVLLAEINPDAPTEDSASFLRTEPLWCAERPAWVTFSGGTAEFVYDRAAGRFGDLGPFLAEAIREHTELLPAPIAPSSGGLRATAIGASQHTVQVSGSTVCVHPTDVVPLRNTPVVRPRISWETLDEEAVAEAVRTALARLDLADARTPVAIVAAWEGSATYARIRAFGAGVVAGLGAHVAAGHPVILVFSGDVGGLVGLHLVEEAGLGVGVISIDGVELREFDYIDIGALIPDSGAVPLVIKSLVFSSTRSDLRKRS